MCHIYTLKAACPKCGAATAMPIPARYSPQDSYGRYRRQLKRLAGPAGGTGPDGAVTASQIS